LLLRAAINEVADKDHFSFWMSKTPSISA